MIRAIRWLNLRRIGRQPLRAALALAAVAAGVSLAVAVLVTSTSLTHATKRLNTSLAGPAPLRVVGAISRGGLLPEVVARIAHAPGVGVAVPAIQAITYVEDRAGHESPVVVVGMDCRVLAPTGCRADAMLVSGGLLRRLGPGAVVRTNQGRVPLAPAVPVSELDGINHGRLLVVSVATADRVFARNGHLDVVYVVPAPGAGLSAVRAALRLAAGPQNTVLGASDPTPWGSNSGPLVPLLAMVSLFALGVGALLVYNITTLSLAERRRDMAIVVALGGTDRLTIAGVASEAAAIGALGGLIGWGAGLVLAHFVIADVNSLTGVYSGVRIGMIVPGLTVVEAVLLGAVAAAAASAIPARRAARLEVSQQLQGRGEPEAVRRAAALRASVALAAGVAGLVACRFGARGGGLRPWQQPVAMGGLVVALVGFLAGVGLATPLVIAAARRHPMMRRGEVGLALASLVRDTGRTAVVATSVAVAVGFGVLLAASLPSIRAMTVRISGIQTDGQVAFNTVGLVNTASIDAKASPALLARVAAFPGVAGVQRESFVFTGQNAGGQPVAAVAREHPTYPFHVVAGRDPAAALARGEVLVGATLARRWHLHPGGSVTLDAPTGATAFVVGTVWEDIESLGNNVTVPWDAAQRLWGSQPSDIAYATPSPGVTPVQLAATMRSAALDPDLRVATPAEVAELEAVAYNDFLGPFRVLQRGLLLVTLIAVMATLLLVGVQRRRELGILAAVGMAPAKLGRQAILEAGVAGVVASLLALAACYPLSFALRDGMLFFVGATAPADISQTALSLSAMSAVLVVLIGAAVPAWQTARMSIVDALHYE